MKTSIEWTQHSWNPVRGCSRVSPGCDNCYAMRMAHRTSGPGGAYEGLTTIRKGKVDWAGLARLVPEQLEVPILRKKPTTYFVNSMSDLFHESLSDDDISAVFGVMAACPQHTFQVLTKRPTRMLAWFEKLGVSSKDLPDLVGETPPPETSLEGSSVLMTAYHRLNGEPNRPFATALNHTPWPLPNVWLGVSCEAQEQADWRIPLLLKCPAVIRWVSAEPLLGPITFRHVPCAMATDIDWVVAGSESGHGARSMELEWIQSLSDQCRDASVPFFTKQIANQNDRKGGDPKHWPEHWPTGVWPREFPAVNP